MNGDSKITPNAAPDPKNEDWEKSLAAGGIPTGVINAKGLDKEINRQLDEYDTLPFWESYRGRVAIIFAVVLNIPIFQLLLQPRFSTLALVLLLIWNIDLIFVYLGYRYAIYPLCIAAFAAPIIIGVELPDGTPFEVMKPFFFLIIIWLIFQLYKAARVEELREKRKKLKGV